jgi:S1-C subfamily serine protease
MKKLKFAAVGLALAGAVAVAVSTVTAQGRAEPEPWTRSRVWTLDGRGAQIGVTVQDIAEGVRIEDVDQDSPASKAGLQTGDVIVQVDGERVRSARQFSRLIQETAEGRSVSLDVMRDGQRRTVDVTPEARGFGFDADLIEREFARGMRDIEPRLRELEPKLREWRFDGPFEFGDTIPLMTSPRSRLGVQLNHLTPELAEYFGAKDGGVLVSRVNKDSPAEKAGLKVGDVIVSVDGDRVRDTDDLVDELRDKTGDITLGIVRDKKESAVKATIEDVRPRARFRRPA